MTARERAYFIGGLGRCSRHRDCEGNRHDCEIVLEPLRRDVAVPDVVFGKASADIEVATERQSCEA